jgi:hypothetical protein
MGVFTRKVKYRSPDAAQRNPGFVKFSGEIVGWFLVLKHKEIQNAGTN